MENLNLVRKIAWSFHKSTGIDYKELFAEASLWYLEAERKFDPSRNCSLAVYAWRVMEKKLIDFSAVEKVRRMHGIYNCAIQNQFQFVRRSLGYKEAATYSMQINELDIDSLKLDNPEGLLDYQPNDFLDTLPDNCRQIAMMLLDSLDQIPEDMPPKLVRGKIINQLRESGWSWPKIWGSFRQMKLALNY